MINPVILQTKLAGLIGFRQPYNTSYQIIDAANLLSRSGYFVNDNPFIKIESIKESQDYSDISDANFNAFLRNKISTSIVNVANAVFNENDFIDRQVIYRDAINKINQTPTGNVNAASNNVNVYDLPPGFNCYWIRVSREKNIAFKIKRVFLEFNGTDSLTLYLFNTADVTTPLKSKVISVTGPFMEVDLDWVCDNTSVGYKGDYYLGYFSTGLTIKPFKREYRNASSMACIEFIDYSRENFPNFTSLSAPFDLSSTGTYPYYNGVNPDITVYEDYTDLIIQNEKLFAMAILLDCQISLLSESVASIRSNRTERISNQYVAQVMAQIEGETGDANVKVKGLRPMFFGAISTIRKELKKLQVGYEGQGQIMVQTLC